MRRRCLALVALSFGTGLSSCCFLQRVESSILPIARMTEPLAVFRVDGLRRDQKLVALTIDDAPSERTGEILDLLATKQATATFFIHGDRIQNRHNRVNIRRMLREGHEVASHMPESFPTYKLSPPVFERQFRRNHEILLSVGARPVRFRPSHGASNRNMRDFMHNAGGKELGYRPHFYLASNFCWDVDWYGIKPERYGRYAAACAKPGRITVFHDNKDVPGWNGVLIDQTARTLKGLPIYLDSLQAKGFSARSLADLEALAFTHPTAIQKASHF
jgi:peptidoglycan/xylan/chitin deacetylase (PgdA/CDA1 family)